MSRYTVHTSSIKALGKTRSDLDLLAGALLTARIGLTGQVILHHRHAVALPFPDGSFDLVWTQNSGMQIADKGRLYHGFFRANGTFGGTLFAQGLPRPLSQGSDGLGYPVLRRRSRKSV